MYVELHHKIPTMVSDGIKCWLRCLEALKLEWIHLIAMVSVSSTFETPLSFSSEFPSNPLLVPRPQYTHLQKAEEFEFPCADWTLDNYKNIQKLDMLIYFWIIWLYETILYNSWNVSAQMSCSIWAMKSKSHCGMTYMGMINVKNVLAWVGHYNISSWKQVSCLSSMFANSLF